MVSASFSSVVSAELVLRATTVAPASFIACSCGMKVVPVCSMYCVLTTLTPSFSASAFMASPADLVDVGRADGEGDLVGRLRSWT